MKYFLNFLALSLLFILSGNPTHAGRKAAVPETELFTITGKVVNLSPDKPNRTIRFIFPDIFSRQAFYLATIDNEGYFKTEIPVSCIQDFYLDYNTLSTLIAIPGEDLTIEVDAAVWTDKSKHESFVRVTGGSAAQANQNILLFNKEKPNKPYIYGAANDAVEKKSPQEYKDYIRQRESEYTTFAEEFNNRHNTSTAFRQWLGNALQYESLEDLMRYAWLHPYYNDSDKDFSLPADYYDFLNRASDLSSGILSAKYSDFMREYYRYTLKHPRERDSLALNAFKKGDFVEGSRIRLQNIEMNSAGLNRQTLLTIHWLDILSSQPQYFKALYSPAKLTDPRLRKLIDDTYKQFRDKQKGKTSSIPLKSIDCPAMEGLIDTILTRYQGKVIYIDFWGIYCSPCRWEMPFSKKAEEQLSGQDIVFLYLCAPVAENLWRSTLTELGLSGEQILLTNDQFNVLSVAFGVVGIPHYSIIDRQGNIAVKEAYNPSFGDLMIGQIKDILRK